MMKTLIVVWTNEDLSGIDDLGVQQVWTEINNAGIVLREIGIATSGKIIYTAPSNHKRLGRGLFDNQKVNLDLQREDDPDLRQRFEKLWVSACS